jgi:hypothetical protein
MSSLPPRVLVRSVPPRGWRRPLLLLLAIAAAVLSAPLVAVRPRPSVGETLARLDTLGGTVEVDETRPDRPIVAVDLHGSSARDEEMRLLGDLPDLRQLNLAATAVTDAGLVYVAQLRHLRGLNLNLTRVDDEGLPLLAGLSELRELSLAGCKVTDAVVEFVERLPRLERVNLYGTGVGDGGIRGLAAARPTLEVER